MEFGRLFSDRFGPDPQWTWRLDHLLEPTVVLSSDPAGVLLSQVLPSQYHQLSPRAVARRLWDEILVRLRGKGR